MSSHHPAPRNWPTQSALHPAVNLALVGTLVWLLAAIWLAFGTDGYTALQLAVSSFLAFMFALVPYGLWLIWRRDHTPAAAQPFGEWAKHDLQTAGGPVEGKDAAVMVLLAPVAVSLGITAMSVIAVLAARGLL